MVTVKRVVRVARIVQVATIARAATIAQAATVTQAARLAGVARIAQGTRASTDMSDASDEGRISILQKTAQKVHLCSKCGTGGLRCSRR